jgi:hypothetical protein
MREYARDEDEDETDGAEGMDGHVVWDAVYDGYRCR